MAQVVHFEIPVDDPDRAKDFYRAVFDWKLEGYGDTPYWLASTGDQGGMGIDGALIGRSEVHRSTVVVIDVEDLDDAVERAVGAGAAEVHPKQAVPGMGWSAYVRDPEGNVIGLWQSDEHAA